MAAKMKSFCASGTLLGLPRPSPVPTTPPSPAVQRLDDLVAAVERARPRVDPDVDAGLHVVEHVPRGERGRREQHAEHQVADRSVATHIITTNSAKNSSDEPRSLLADHHHDGEAPGDEDRGDVARLGEVERPDPPRACGDQLAPLGEVAGEEDRRGRSWRTRRAGS
jgi:hypothetical protein